MPPATMAAWSAGRRACAEKTQVPSNALVAPRRRRTVRTNTKGNSALHHLTARHSTPRSAHRTSVATSMRRTCAARLATFYLRFFFFKSAGKAHCFDRLSLECSAFFFLAL